MLRIGLTGGIGSGKSRVTRLFAQRGVPIVDTDTIAHEVVEPGQPGLARLIAAFGDSIIRGDGRLNRHALRERVFQDPELRRKLETILHPIIRERMQHSLAHITAPYVILVIPLLLEKGWQKEVDRILVVDTTEDLQISRTMRRDGIDAAMVKRIMYTQVSRTTRLEAADDIIHNEGNYKELERQVESLHHHYLTIASS